MNHKQSHRILRMGQFGCFVPLALAYLLSQDPELTKSAVTLCMLGAVMFFGAVIQALLFYRCPHCDAPFEIRSFRPDYCSRCGKRIDW